MLSALAKSSGLGISVAATSNCVASATRPVITGLVQKAQDVVVPPAQETLTSDTLARTCLSKSGFLQNKATVGLSCSSQYRLAHSDVQVPDFSDYRHDDPRSVSQQDSHSTGRRAFTYLVFAGGCVPGTYAAKSIVTELLTSMSASADVLALAKIEVKLDDIPEGKNATFKWRGKPLFVRHRSAEEIETEQSVDPTSLRDQQHDNDRVQKPEWLVLLGVCTHLGCVPIPNMGEYGGYYCPCHGSHYDASGRIRKGPAPLNLEVPEYVFPDEGTLLVG